MKNISRLFIIVLAIVFPLLAGNVVPSQAGISVIDEYGIGFYNLGDGTGWHDWQSGMDFDPFGNLVLIWLGNPIDLKRLDPNSPGYFDIVAFENGNMGKISDVVRVVGSYPIPPYGTFSLYVFYSDNSDIDNDPDILADVGIIPDLFPLYPYYMVEEQLDETFSVDFGNGDIMLVYSKGHAAIPEPATIDIKPGSFPNSINPSYKGVIPVAILGSSTFDVTQVNYSTVCFAGDCTIEAHGVHFEDVNGDGFIDAILHFATPQTNIKRGDTQACLRGQLDNGHYFVGCDSVRTVPR